MKRNLGFTDASVNDVVNCLNLSVRAEQSARNVPSVGRAKMMDLDDLLKLRKNADDDLFVVLLIKKNKILFKSCLLKKDAEENMMKLDPSEFEDEEEDNSDILMKGKSFLEQRREKQLTKPRTDYIR